MSITNNLPAVPSISRMCNLQSSVVWWDKLCPPWLGLRPHSRSKTPTLKWLVDDLNSSLKAATEDV